MAFPFEQPHAAGLESVRTELELNHNSAFVRNFGSDIAGLEPIVINHERKRLSLAALEKTPPHKRFVISEGRMKKFVLASLFVVAAAAMQPALAAGAGWAGALRQRARLCACGKLPGAMLQCCHARPRQSAIARVGCRTASITKEGGRLRRPLVLGQRNKLFLVARNQREFSGLPLLFRLLDTLLARRDEIPPQIARAFESRPAQKHQP